jgi:hypothetical protein
MNKVWGYISAVLVGVVLGIVIGVKWLAGKDVSVEVRRINNRRTTGDTTIPIEVDVNRRRLRKNRKDGRV